MNCRARSASRLATAVVTALPLFQMETQFFRPMLAVLKNPNRSFFINCLERGHRPGVFQNYHSTGRDGARRSNRLAHPFQNHIRHVRLGADG